MFYAGDGLEFALSIFNKSSWMMFSGFLNP